MNKKQTMKQKVFKSKYPKTYKSSEVQPDAWISSEEDFNKSSNNEKKWHQVTILNK